MSTEGTISIVIALFALIFQILDYFRNSSTSTFSNENSSQVIPQESDFNEKNSTFIKWIINIFTVITYFAIFIYFLYEAFSSNPIENFALSNLSSTNKIIYDNAFQASINFGLVSITSIILMAIILLLFSFIRKNMTRAQRVLNLLFFATTAITNSLLLLYWVSLDSNTFTSFFLNSQNQDLIKGLVQTYSGMAVFFQLFYSIIAGTLMLQTSIDPLRMTKDYQNNFSKVLLYSTLIIVPIGLLFLFKFALN
ncbi:hypothetical protein [Enterococcus sp. LJL90]